MAPEVTEYPEAVAATPERTEPPLETTPTEPVAPEASPEALRHTRVALAVAALQVRITSLDRRSLNFPIMYAYIKNGRLDSFSEEFFQKPVPESEITVTLEAEDGTKTEKKETVPGIPGLAYDECVEYDFNETPVFEDGAIVPYSESRRKIEDDQRKTDEESIRKETRKSEIRTEIGMLAKQRDGLVELGGDEEVREIQKRIDELKDEYALLN